MSPEPIPFVAPNGEIRNLASVLIERLQWMRQHGVSFDGMRDLYAVLGYDRIITPQQYRERYARGGIAGRIVDAMPKATWRGGFELIEDEDPKVSTSFEKAWIALEKRLKISAVFLKTDILVGQGRYAVLLLGAPGESLSEPLPKGKPEDLKYLMPFSEEDAKIQSWEIDIKNERFGQPTSYMLSRTSANTLYSPYGGVIFNSIDLAQPVHWSRCIHIAENTIDNDVFGAPRLERVWNLLDDLDKVLGGGAEAFWLRANQGLHLNVDKDMTFADATGFKKDLEDQAEKYQHEMRRMIRTRGVEINTLGSDVANFSNPADAIVTQLAGATAIPKRILTGSEMGELASSQDRENFRDQVNGRQSGFAGPYIVVATADRLIEYGYLEAPKKKEGYKCSWSHIGVRTEQEKADGANKWALTTTAEGPVFSRDEIRDEFYMMDPWPKPDINPDTGEHTAPETGLPLNPAIDPETGLPILKSQPTIAVDPETGLPVEVDTKTGLPAHTTDPETGKPKPGVKNGGGLPGLLKAAETIVEEDIIALVDAMIAEELENAAD
jgi:uncharacterized protein